MNKSNLGLMIVMAHKKTIKILENEEQKVRPQDCKSYKLPKKPLVLTPARKKNLDLALKKTGQSNYAAWVDMCLEVSIKYPENLKVNSIQQDSNGKIKQQFKLLKELIPKETEHTKRMNIEMENLRNEVTELKGNITLLTKMISEINPKAKELYTENLESKVFFKGGL